MADRKQLPDLPEATDVSPDDLFLKRDTGETTDQHAGAQLVADKLLSMGQVESSTGQQTVGEALDQRVIYVDTVADLQALDTSGLVEGQAAVVEALGAYFFESGAWRKSGRAEYQWRVPTDYPSVKSAIEEYSGTQLPEGGRLEILIESGHVIDEQVVLYGGDYSKVTISSEDPEVEVEEGSISSIPFRLGGRNPVFAFMDGCNGPLIDILLNVQSHTANVPWGFFLANGSNLVILPGKGAKGATNGVQAYDNSSVTCVGSVFTHARQSGITAWGNSRIYANEADASFSETYGIRSTEGSSLVFQGGVATDCGRHSARAVSSSFIDVTGADLSRSATKGLYIREGCVAEATGAVAADCVEHGFLSTRGSIMNAVSSNADGCGVGYESNNSSSINAPTSSAIDCVERSLVCTRGSTANVRQLQCGGTPTAIFTELSSRVEAGGASGASGDNGIACHLGSITNADSCSFTGYSINGARVFGGSLSCNGGDFSDCGVGIYANEGADVVAWQATVSGCDTGLDIRDSSVNFRSGVATGCARSASLLGGKLDARRADMSGSTGGIGILLEEGSDANLVKANLRKGAENDSNDIRVLTSSIVRVRETIGGVNIVLNSPQTNGLALGSS